MPKNILVFSDGTGQAGGLVPDQRTTNVYKLYRATRCGPDTDIDPSKQLAYYDPGIGSAASGADIRIGWARWVYNLVCQATGLGITANIVDCYSAIVRMYEPGDRIFLFGFSRGAYTARCVAGVLGLCGVPTRMKDGSPLKRDPTSAKAIAAEAVKQVYQFGSSIKGDPLKSERQDRAGQFRNAYGSDERGDANAVPYFIGVWDTVAALRSRVWLLTGVLVATLALTAVVAAIARSVASSIFGELGFWPVFFLLFIVELAGLAVWYFSTHINLPRSDASLGPRLSGYGMVFYDTTLNPRVSFARHAMSIDENRADFARVPWSAPPEEVQGQATSGAVSFKQIWFAGNHADVGGGYDENKSRLSDITLSWMIEQTREIPSPIQINSMLLITNPSSAGVQHDEVRAGIAGVPSWLQFLFRWKVGLRRVPVHAPLHPSVIERLQLIGVQQFDVTEPYRPAPLREHQDVRQFY